MPQITNMRTTLAQLRASTWRPSLVVRVRLVLLSASRIRLSCLETVRNRKDRRFGRIYRRYIVVIIE